MARHVSGPFGRSLEKPKMDAAERLPLTEECHHWQQLGEVPWDLQKYVSSLFSPPVQLTYQALQVLAATPYHLPELQ